MQSVTQLVFEYLELQARRSVEPWALKVTDNQRLGALERAFGVRGADGGRRRHSRKPACGTGELHIGIARTNLELIDIGVGGAKVACPLPLGIGQRAILRLWAPCSGYPTDTHCEVVWRGDACMGLRFFGRPERVMSAVPLGFGPDEPWRASAIGW